MHTFEYAPSRVDWARSSSVRVCHCDIRRADRRFCVARNRDASTGPRAQTFQLWTCMCGGHESGSPPQFPFRSRNSGRSALMMQLADRRHVFRQAHAPADGVSLYEGSLTHTVAMAAKDVEQAEPEFA